MANDKFRYYEVWTSTVVKAKNQRDAVALATEDAEVPGEILLSGSYADRITAAEARAMVSE